MRLESHANAMGERNFHTQNCHKDVIAHYQWRDYLDVHQQTKGNVAETNLDEELQKVSQNKNWTIRRGDSAEQQTTYKLVPRVYMLLLTLSPAERQIWIFCFIYKSHVIRKQCTKPHNIFGFTSQLCHGLETNGTALSQLGDCRVSMLINPRKYLIIWRSQFQRCAQGHTSGTVMRFCETRCRHPGIHRHVAKSVMWN